MAKLYNLARMSVSAAPGIGSVTLGTNVNGLLTFAAAGLVAGQSFTYAISDGASSEIGRGTAIGSPVTSFSRDTVLASTASGAAINASANAQVEITAAAEDFIHLDVANTWTAAQTFNAFVGIGVAPSYNLDLITSASHTSTGVKIAAPDNNFMLVLPSANVGSWNPTTQVGDTVIVFSPQGAPGTIAGALNIVPWSATGSGIRITNTGQVQINNATTTSTNTATSLIAAAFGTTLGTTAQSYLYPFEFQANAGNLLRLQLAPYRRVAGSAWQGTAWRIQPAVDNIGTTGTNAYIEIGTSDPATSGGGFIALGTAGVDRLWIGSSGIVRSAAAIVAGESLWTAVSSGSFVYAYGNNANTVPNSASSSGGAMGWNYSSSSGEVNFWNTYSSVLGTNSFHFRQILSTPTGFTATAVATGGTFAAATYYWKVSATNATGETFASTEASAAIAANGSATLAWTAVSGATGYKIYRATAAGGETGANSLVASVGAVTTYTDTGTATTAGSIIGSPTASIIVGYLGPTGLNLPQTTASTSVGTGALVVTGGAGIGGVLNVGGNLVTANNAYLGSRDNAGLFDNTHGGRFLTYTDNNVYIDALNAGSSISLRPNGGLTTAQITGSQLSILPSTATTGPTTGALVVTGGVGIGSGVNINGTYSQAVSSYVGATDSRAANVLSCSDNTAYTGKLLSTLYVQNTSQGSGDGSPAGTTNGVIIAAQKANWATTSVLGETNGLWVTAFGGDNTSKAAYNGNGDVSGIIVDARSSGSYDFTAVLEGVSGYYATNGTVRTFGCRVQLAVAQNGGAAIGHNMGVVAINETGGATQSGPAFYANNNGGSWSYAVLTSAGGYLTMAGVAGSTSDPSMKTNIRRMPSVLSLIEEIEPIIFEWVDPTMSPPGAGKDHFGFAAKNHGDIGGVFEAFDNLGYDFGGHHVGHKDKSALEHHQLGAVNWRATQELLAMYRSLQARVSKLEAAKH